MELDELKLLLRSKEDIQQPLKSAEELRALLGTKAVSILSKIKRSLWKELITCLFATIVLISVAIFTKYSSIRIYFLIFSFVCLVFFPVLWFLLKKVNRLGSEALPVKTNLQQLHKILKQYVKLYFQLTMALIPIAMLLALWLGYNDELLNHDDFALTKLSVKLLFMVTYVLVFSTVMYFFTRWYIKKLYGNYIEQLQSLIKELEE